MVVIQSDMKDMKMNFVMNGITHQLRTALFAGTVLLIGNIGVLCQAQPDPTTVTWDCVMTGPREGIAYLNFAGDNTFDGYEILVPKARKSGSSDPTGRGDNGIRGDDDNSGPALNGTQLFGATPLSGVWGFDINGRLIGNFIETSTLENCTTNAVAISTNGVGLSNPNQYCITDTNNVTICYTNQIVCSALTNQISFFGKVVTGQRLTLVCYTPFGKITYRGVPAVILPDLSGSWYGVKQQDGQTFLEFFTLTPTINPNIYDVAGSGPAYSYSGSAVLSIHRKIGFVAAMDPDGDVLRSVIGSFKPSKFSSKTHGWEQPNQIFTDPIKFEMTRSSP
jgi:hypothetical protein